MLKINSRNQKKAFSLIEISIVILIIGILISGIASSSRLVAKSRLSAAQNLTRKSPVTEISNLSSWWETTLDESVKNVQGNKPKNDEKIATWIDINSQSTVRSNFTQSNTSLQPLYKSKGINGLPSVYFDSSLGQQKLIGTNPSLYGGKSFTVFNVILPTSPTSYGSIISNASYTGGGYYSGYAIVYIGSSSTALFSNATSSGGWEGSSSNNIAANDRGHIIASSINTDNAKKMYVNGVIKLNSSVTSYGPSNPTYPSYSLSIGSVFGSGDTFTGYINEVIIFDRVLEDDERVDVEKYLSKKWGIPLQ